MVDTRAIYQCPNCGYENIFSEFVDDTASGSAKCPSCTNFVEKKPVQEIKVKSILKIKDWGYCYALQVRHDKGGCPNYYGTQVDKDKLTDKAIKELFKADEKTIRRNIHGRVYIDRYIVRSGARKRYDFKQVEIFTERK